MRVAQGMPCRLVLAIAGCLAIVCAPVGAQSCKGGDANGAPPSFVVASIRPTPGSARNGTSMGEYGHSRFRLTGFNLSGLVGFAYDVDSRNYLGAPKGLEGTTYDVSVECEDDVALSYERLQPLMQQMLQTRFGLIAHKGTKQVPGYRMVVAKGGLKLKAAPPDESSSFQIAPTQIYGRNTDLATFARVLVSVAGRPVADATGPPGAYDIVVSFARSENTDSSLPSIFTAMKEQLGLELQPSPVPVDTLTIEHVNLTPTEN